MSTKFDIFLACAPKDFRKLPYVITSIAENISGFDKLFICSPYDVPTEIKARFPIMFYTYLDENVLPGIDREQWSFRPNWCYQQHLKLFQRVTSDWYLTIDCDIIINREMKFYEGDKPIYYRGMNQFYQPYFKFMKEIIDLERVSDQTYIADMNFIYRPIIQEILDRSGYTIETFIKKSQQITSRLCHIGEPELYGNYCKKYYPDMYVERDLIQAPFVGRHQDAVDENKYTEDEIEAAIYDAHSQQYDALSLHSWLNEGDQD